MTIKNNKNKIYYKENSIQEDNLIEKIIIKIFLIKNKRKKKKKNSNNEKFEIISII